MIRPSMVSVAIALVGCSKSPSDTKAAGSAAPPPTASAAADAGPAPEPSEAATVVGPTRSATGALEVSGAMTGTFEWKKKDQRSPMSCAWNAEKEIGGVKIDLSDGAGHLLTLALDAPPVELGVPKLDVTSKDLSGHLKTSKGFNISGDDAGNITVKLDTKLGDDKPLTIKGTLEVSCPPKK